MKSTLHQSESHKSKWYPPNLLPSSRIYITLIYIYLNGRPPIGSCFSNLCVHFAWFGVCFDTLGHHFDTPGTTWDSILAFLGLLWTTLGKGVFPRAFYTTLGGTCVASATLEGRPMSLKHCACRCFMHVSKNALKGHSRRSRDPRHTDYPPPSPPLGCPGGAPPEHQFTSKAFLLGSRARPKCSTPGSEARVSSFCSHSWW